MMKRQHWCFALVAMIMGCMLTACGDDEENINDIIVGTWVLDNSVHPTGYEIVPDDGTEITIDRLELRADKTFTLVYDEYDSDSGTYEAGNAYLRFDYTDVNKRDEVFLWQVLSFSDHTLNAKYKDTNRDLQVTVWLVKKE